MPTYARKNLVKEKLKNGQRVLGMEVWLRDSRVIELLGDAGFDFAHIEYEHVARNWEGMEDNIRAAELRGLTPLFRTEQAIGGEPPSNQIIKALKAGAQIIMVPHVETPEVAKKIVHAAKFAPMGKRGLATCDRSAMEIFPNARTPLDIKKYTRELNDEIMLWCIIETPLAVQNIDAILAVDGIDAVGFGHQDYSMAAGFDADNGPQVDEAREKVRAAAKRAGKYMWWNTSDPAIVRQEAAKGMNLFLIGVDTIHMNKQFHALSTESRK